MRNLDCSQEVPNDFFDTVLASKRNSNKDPDYTLRVEGYKPNVRLHFDDYNLRFGSNTLVGINPIGYNGQVRDDLLKLYKYDNSVIQKLKTEITTSINGRIINSCQNCTINAVNSLDHIVPKEEASEFSVHPKNLFPSCSQCNGIKNRFWRENGQFLFLNLYTDSLPNLQYLFPIVNYNNGVPEINFSINNPNGIDGHLYNIISSHYTRLDLINRFILDADGVVSDLQYRIHSLKGELSRQQIIDSIINYENAKRANNGYNYWKSLLTIELVNCKALMDFFFLPKVVGI
ncbi:hypothetical protein SAMN05428642_104187 [Flaviramulus basaltis]|uniref:HNH domain-containing protein n=1 Tax=Flaviramulus basaltis TaxID=369401 RepID=A0A1K2IPU6_9FLAO|nr:HNH endonuclease [Flaviramulus basaltis]SFZ94449.1 hypothetical protein SAMN05428642_104187 [Flaviramulus basaltis]